MTVFDIRLCGQQNEWSDGAHHAADVEPPLKTREIRSQGADERQRHDRGNERNDTAMHGTRGQQRDAAENDEELLQNVSDVALQVQQKLEIDEKDERLQNEQKSKQVLAPRSSR